MSAIKIDKQNFYLFGNKGDSLWSKNTHIAETGLSGRTLCGKPMQSTNYARLENIQEPGCPDCIARYKEEFS